MAKGTRTENLASDVASATNSNDVSNGSDGFAKKWEKRRSGNYGERPDTEMGRSTAMFKEGSAPRDVSTSVVQR